MTGLLITGFFLGMTHATEADHIAAVATLATSSRSARDSLWTGLLWGLGHMTMLCVVGGVALIAGTVIPADTAAALEACVGVMLVALGLDVLWRARRAVVQLQPLEPIARPPWRAFVVGLVHGLAGSAALVVLAAGAAHSPSTGLGYILVFGVGSVLGMALISIGMAVPLHFASRRVPSIARWLGIATGLLSIIIGATVIAAATSAG